MRPSEVRERVLEDHARLRELLSELQQLAGRVLEGQRELESQLRTQGQLLRERFLAHLDMEDRYLVPALRETVGWGEERAARVSAEHAEQRQRMDVILRHLVDLEEPAEWIAAELATLVRDLLMDMEHEDRAVLSEDLLRDDPVAIDLEAG